MFNDLVSRVLNGLLIKCQMLGFESKKSTEAHVTQ